MRGDIFDNMHSYFRESERDEGGWSADRDPPKAAAVIGDFGLNLAAALSFAFIVCAWLSAVGIPAP